MTTDEQMLSVQRELTRIFGEVVPEEAADLLVLPLPTPEIALRFLATVPAGASYEEAARLLAQFTASENSKGLGARFRW